MQAMTEDSDRAGRRGDAAWQQASESIDRIISVALTLEEPQTAAWIAEEAGVSESTTRKHCERLVDLRALTSATAHGVTTYAPASAYFRFRDVSRFAQEHTEDELLELSGQIKDTLEEQRETYDAETPDELRSRAADPETSADQTREYRQVSSEWESLEYRLSVIREAIDRYDEYSQGHLTA